MSGETLGILVGGGPAPGINGVIASATIEARKNGLSVVGIYDGYRHIARGDATQVVPLDVDDVSHIHGTGGSILRTSRTNPAADEATLDRCVSSLTQLGVRYLIAIGGDDTTYGASRIAERAQGRIAVATVPKTIDNDLPLPDNAPTFGFETARSVATGIVESLIEDARTTGRWYLVVSMGRKSGALALGMCASAGATLAVIPEDFAQATLELDTVVDTIAGAVVKRKAQGYGHGVAVLAEGLVERLSVEELAHLQEVPRDSYGHVRLADVPIGAVVRDALRRRLSEMHIDTAVVTKDIGYELRCAKPVALDVEYTRMLGYGAVQYLLGGGSGALIALAGGVVAPLQLDDLRDPATGRVRVRMVDVTTQAYAVARNYMTRLDAADLAEPQLARLAAAANLSNDAFRARFANVV
ncbi:MAG: 6-phosphofructokinase [Candidatus Eremiobacteraeota bacterium]|nr:6-phosphofructokinase [Candidatus Eremiobacteraeota bacterium]